LAGDFTIEYVELADRHRPARDFIENLDDDAAAKVDALISRLRAHGTQMRGKFVTKLTKDIFELRVKHFDRIFRVLFFYQPGRMIVLTSGFQKQTQRTPPGEIKTAERLRDLWLRYRNHYPQSVEERRKILRREFEGQ
jgi:phage-related protein